MKAVPKAVCLGELLGSYSVVRSVHSMVVARAAMMVGSTVDTRAGKTAANSVAMMAKVMDDASESLMEAKAAA